MSIVPYLLKLSISLAVIFLFYQLVLRRLTFYNWNRWYLLLYSFLAFFLPFINLSPVLEQQQWTTNGWVQLIPAVGDYELMKTDTAVSETVNWSSVLVIGSFIIGMLVMLVRLGMQYFSLIRLRRSAQLILDDKVKVYQVDKSIIPFSFGNAIYLNQHLHNEDELKEIIRHEFVHVKQRHSLDIIWIELFCLLNWYNPFAWLMRKAIRQNLEFIADRQVLQHGFDRKQYQYLLLKVTGVSSFSITSNFNFSSLKKRIAMMNKTKSAKVHLTRFLFVLPLLVVVLLAFRNTVQNELLPVPAITVNDTTPKAQRLPDNVSSIEAINGRRVTVTLKDGSVERFDLAKNEERLAFEKKYGKIPDPPAPPEAPAAPAAAGEFETPVPPVQQVEVPKNYFTDCINKKGYCITVADNMGECVVIVKDKNMKIVEAVKLTDWDANEKSFEEKYGELPPAPPPHPAIPPVKARPGRAPLPPPAPARGVSGVHVQTNDEIIVAGHYEPAISGSGNFTSAGNGGNTRSTVNVSGRGTATTSASPSVNGTNAVNATSPTRGVAVAGGEQIVDREILGVIKNNTTREQLDQLLKDLKAKGYLMKIADTKFKDGKLLSIVGSVANEDGTGNWHFSATDFVKITLTALTGEKGIKYLNIIVSDGKVTV